MEIEIDMNNILPVYEQIVQQVTQGILRGTLPPGHSLPSIRQLASDLGLNHNTVARAYKLLESRHIIQTAGRRGTFVHKKAAQHIARNNNQNAQLLLDELVTEFRAAGIAKSDIHALLHKQLNQLEG